ncbi:MAG: hypothetical protein V2A67_11505 [Bacteroidota bacterium]
MVCSFYACEKPDNLPQMEIHILDADNQPVPGAYAALFANYEEWISLDNPVQVWRKSDAAGHILFSDLDEAIYYIYVRSGEADNALNEISTSQPLVMNERLVVVIHIQ